MPSFVIAGASRGIGFALLQTLSQDPANTVFALVRSKADAETKIRAELPDRKNIYVIYADLEKLDTLKAAASEVSHITGGSLDVLFANAAIGSTCFAPLSVQALRDTAAFEEDMNTNLRVNLFGSIYVISVFAPLIRAGNLKKIVALSSAVGDPDFIVDTELFTTSPYCISKAALNLAIAKFHAEFKEEGTLVMGISPGLVDTGHDKGPELENEEAQAGLARFAAAIKSYEPAFAGPITPQQSAEYVLQVAQRATITANGGRTVSHWGNKRWL